MKSINEKITKFLATITNEAYNLRYTFATTKEVLNSINLMSGNSGFHTPKAIKINNVEGIFFLFESGQICMDLKVIEVEGKFQILEMKLNTYNELERFVSSN